MKIFNELKSLGLFPDNMKKAKVTPIFKSGKRGLLTNYTSISVLLCFSVLSERVMYNRVYKYFDKNNIPLSRKIWS